MYLLLLIPGLDAWTAEQARFFKFKFSEICVQFVQLVSPGAGRGQPYVLIINFYVESGQKLIQFNIQFKIE